MLSPSQQRTLMTVLDTFVPQLSKNQAQALLKTHRGIHLHSDPDQIRRLLDYAKTKTSDLVPSYEHAILPFLTHLGASHIVNKVIKMMNNGIGMCVLTKGRWTTSFDDLDEIQRQELLVSLKSRKSPHRLIYRVLCITALFLTYSKYSLWFLLEQQQQQPPCPRWSVVPWTEQNQLRFDAIVIGSGAAAGPCALELSKAGKSVLVIEKGSMVTDQTKSCMNGYNKGNYWTSMDGNLTLDAGVTWGGGTSVSHGALVKTPLHVLQDWKRRTNDGFDVQKFEKDLQTVVDTLGATSDHLDHNRVNRTLIHGCQQLDHPVSIVPNGQNGSIWLQQAQDHGAQFLFDANVTQILVRNGHVDGVQLTLSNGQPLTLQARTVVVAAGAIQTPTLLMKSGLKNKHIGQHLRVHPTVFINGYFPSSSSSTSTSTPGAITATHHMKTSDSFGCRIEAPPMNPDLFAATMNWHGGLHHKQSMLGYNNGCPLMIMGRDMNSTGHTTDNGQIKFDFSDRDLDTLNLGVIRAMDILVSAGARHLHSCHLDLDPFLFKSLEPVSPSNPRYLSWIDQIRHAGLYPADGIFSFAQMGSCRLGHSPKTSAVQLTGESWEVKNLYVADASIMPSACGVHPILTIQALALGVARKVILRLNSRSLV